LFFPNSGKEKGDSPKKDISGALKSINGKLKPNQMRIKEDPTSQRVSVES